jgi:hypothetical protein
MNYPPIRRLSKVFFILVTILMFAPTLAIAQDFKVFNSDEFGFSMKYPGSWFKNDQPKGSYFVVFTAPDLSDNVRPRINVAAHKPVKDPMNAYLNDFRKGIADLQKEKQEVKIIDEGDFKSESPGSYYFFIRTYELNLKAWLDIVIVYYKNDQTLVRVSCIAPSSQMEKFHQAFNEVLLSMRFSADPASASARPQQPSEPAPSTLQPPSQQVQPVQPRTQQGQPQTGVPSVFRQEQETSTVAPQPSAPARPLGPRGPSRDLERPGTGLVN